jgi:hypothetical protein
VLPVWELSQVVVAVWLVVATVLVAVVEAVAVVAVSSMEAVVVVEASAAAVAVAAAVVVVVVVQVVVVVAAAAAAAGCEQVEEAEEAAAWKASLPEEVAQSECHLEVLMAMRMWRMPPVWEVFVPEAAPTHRSMRCTFQTLHVHRFTARSRERERCATYRSIGVGSHRLIDVEGDEEDEATTTTRSLFFFYLHQSTPHAVCPSLPPLVAIQLLATRCLQHLQSRR